MQQPNYLIYIINIQKLTHFKAHQNLFISDLNHSVISSFLKPESLWSPRRRHAVLRTKLRILPATSNHWPTRAVTPAQRFQEQEPCQKRFVCSVSLEQQYSSRPSAQGAHLPFPELTICIISSGSWTGQIEKKNSASRAPSSTSTQKHQHFYTKRGKGGGSWRTGEQSKRLQDLLRRLT